MDEKELLETNETGVEAAAADVGTEAAETVEETAVADIAGDEAGETDVLETAGDGSEEVPEDEETEADGDAVSYSDGSDDGGIRTPADEFTPKASKKTTAVLFAIIAVLVILIAVFAVIIAGKLKEKKEAEKSKELIPTSAVSAVTAVPADDGEDGSEQADAAPVVKKDYNVTVQLGEYRGLEVDFPEVEVTDEDVNDELSDFLEEHSELKEVTDRTSQLGDTLNIDYVGYMDGEEFDGGTDSDVEFVLGSGQFFDAFEDGLVGAEVGEHTLELNFPDDYYEDLAGKPVTFVVTINGIYEKWTPALTDDLIKENTEYETVSEYKAYIEGYLMEEATADAEEQANAEIIQQAIDNTTYSGDIDEEIEDMTAQYIEYYDSMAQNYYGVDGATLFSYFYGMNEDEYKEYLKNESAYAIKLQYLLDKVAEIENLTYTQEEFDAEFEEIFISYYGFADREEAEGQYTSEEIDDTVSKSLLREKAQNLITGSASINR